MANSYLTLHIPNGVLLFSSHLITVISIENVSQKSTRHSLESVTVKNGFEYGIWEEFLSLTTFQTIPK